MTLLLSGYIRDRESALHLDEYIGGVPDVIVKIMCFFVGKKYFIHCAQPEADEYDYAMELLSPIESIGLTHRKSYIMDLLSPRARNNIVAGSRIIQINEVPITTESPTSEVDRLLQMAKRQTPRLVP